MKNQMSCLFSLVAIAMVAGDAFAAASDIRTWTDASGDHRWNNAQNWDTKTVASTRNVFPAGRDWEVIIEGTDKWYFSFELPEGAGTVTLKGADSAKLQSGTGAFIQIAEGRELNVDGPDFSVSGTDMSNTGFISGTLRLSSGRISTGNPVFAGNANVIVDGGLLGGSDLTSTFTFTNNATLTINGGVAAIYRGLFRSPDPPRESITRVYLNGGTYWNCDANYGAYTTSFDAGAHFANNGGTLIWCRDNVTVSEERSCLDSAPSSSRGQGAAFADLLPAFGGTLVVPTPSTKNPGALLFSVDGDYDVGGTIYVTNNTSVATGNIYFDSSSIALRGGATIYANALRVNAANACTINLDIARLNLGIGGFRDYSSKGVWKDINFLDGTVFGAWGGDVPGLFASSPSQRSRTYLYGPVVYDTADCFEPATPRTINMDRLYLSEVTELKATGGGTAALYPVAKWAEEFRTIEVADNTTLAFCTNQLAGLKAMNLKLGANAKLKINMNNGDYVDASATAEFGDGAKIVVTDVPATLTEGMFYPVYFAPAGTDPDLSKIEYAGGAWPAGWSLAKTGNAVYLTDGKVTAYDEPRTGSDKIWSGAGSDNVFANSDNWVSNSVPGSATQAFFKGCSNTVVSVTDAATLRYFKFFSNCGPFMFSGKLITFQYPSSDVVGIPSVQSGSKFPVVISNRLRSDNAIRFLSYGEGSIAATGGGGVYDGNVRPLDFGGDVRLGGDWTSRYVRVQQRYDASSVAVRNSRLTVMPGATLTVLEQGTNQERDFNANGRGALAVAMNAVATIGGTQLLLTSNNTHYVDGALTVTCPLVPQGRQTFRGDGTLTLTGGVASAPGGVRVEGNLTLVPSNWSNDVELSVKDNVTIAPTANWTYSSASNLVLSARSTLTIATGGHTVRFLTPIVSDGDVVVSGGGKVVFAPGTKLNSLVCQGGAVLDMPETGASGYEEMLALRSRGEGLVFDGGLNVKERCDASANMYIYSGRRKRGMMLIYR